MFRESEYMNSELSRGLYRNYGVAEWHKKSQILSKEEAIFVLKALESGEENGLTELVKLPFPRFVTEYFSKYSENIKGDNKSKYIRALYEDPAFGYKLYFLGDVPLRFFSEKARNPELTRYEFIATGKFKKTITSNYKDFFIIVNTPYEEIPKLNIIYPRQAEIKYAYLTQYIDAAEARRLKLSISTLFDSDGANGFELEAKLDSLNSAVRSIIVLYLGLYGETRLSLRDIAQKLGLAEEHTLKAINIIFPYLSRTLGEFRNAIGYLPDNQNTGGMKQYTNKAFRDIDILLQTRYIFNTLPETDRQTLESYSKKERTIYIASKYMFRTPESLANNLTISVADATERLKKI